MSRYGEFLHLTIFGQSHAPAIGMILEGLPAGETIDMAALQTFLDRRAPGRNDWSTPRKEADQPEFLSGLVGNVTCGAPLTAIIRNTNTRSGDYDGLSVVPRPGHADYTAYAKYHGFQDARGGEGQPSWRSRRCGCSGSRSSGRWPCRWCDRSRHRRAAVRYQPPRGASKARRPGRGAYPCRRQ